MNKFRRKLKIESLIKSALYSLLVSSILFILIEVVVWINKLNILISIIPSLVFFIISFPIFYFKKFKMSEIQIAKRIDELGLEERVLTMVELKEDDSIIAKKQREDAVRTIKEVDDIKIKTKKPSIISSLMFGLSILVLSLSFMFPDVVIAHGEVSSIEVSVEGDGFVIDYSKYENQSLINAVAEKQKKDEINRINGKQVVELKQFPTPFSNRISINYRSFEDIDATMVLDGANFSNVTYEIKSDESHILMALPYKGFVFIGWSDGCASPFREIYTYSTDLTALFDEVSSIGEDLPDEQKEPSDKDDSKGGSGESDGSGKDGDGSGKTNIDDGWGDGAKGSPANQVINGETYYGDIFNQSYQEAVERVKNNPNLTEAQKKAISDYFESIRKN